MILGVFELRNIIKFTIMYVNSMRRKVKDPARDVLVFMGTDLGTGRKAKMSKQYIQP